MNRLIYFAVLPLLYLISILPFWLMYPISDVMFFVLYYLVGYRKKVVAENLKNSFPEKSSSEIQSLSKAYYRFLCDLILESIKCLTISKRSLEKHITIGNLDIVEHYYQKNQNIIYVMGHYGNWELSGARFALLNYHQIYGLYHPLKNKYFDNFFYKMRIRFGNKLYAMNDAFRSMVRDKDILSATTFIADQTPSKKNAHWLTFLNQDTPVFLGTEKIATKFNYPVLYVSTKRIKRGYYHLTVELVSESPKLLAPYELTAAHIALLERDIKACPEIWLWSHRRWKHKRES